MEMLEILKNRYSVRSFKDEKIKRDELNKILLSATFAPSAKNYQPVKIIVIESEKYLSELNKICKCIYNAKTVLLLCYDKNLAWVNKRRVDYNTGELDTGILATHIMLECFDLNIGTVCVGMFNDEELKSALNLSDNLIPVLLMPLGYPTDDSVPLIGFHDKNKTIEEIVEYR